jgi:hypothetical protein
MVERLLDDMTAMLVNLTCREGGIRMNIQMGCLEEIEERILENLPLSCGDFQYEIMEEDVVIHMTFPEGDDNA